MTHRTSFRSLFAILLPALILAACSENTGPVTPQADAPRGAVAPASDVQLALGASLDQMNAGLAAAGANYRVAYAEYVTGGSADEAGQTVFATDRQLRLTAQWVPGDARRDADGELLTYMNDDPFMVANGVTPTEAAVNASFDTWDTVACSAVDLVERPWNGGLNSAILTWGGPPGDIFAADIVTVGWLPGFLFDAVLGPGSSTRVLGVTFGFIFIDGPGGPPTDINGDGFSDLALKEVWYNNAFLWNTAGAGPGVDVETVALHENGHAVGLGHFGRVFRTTSNGKLHVSPRASMNAFILGVLRAPLGTDNASYCSLYAAWPN